MTSATLAGVRANTTRFGEIDVDPDLVITLPDGVLGFERCRRYVVVQQGDTTQFKWLQALDDGTVAFPVIDPWQFKPDYAPTLSDADAAQLELGNGTPQLVFAIVTVPRENPRAMTANLLAPVVINARTRQGKQVIVRDDIYTTRHSVIEELQRRR
jgi:flagellar assembly factor FliW